MIKPASVIGLWKCGCGRFGERSAVESTISTSIIRTVRVSGIRKRKALVVVMTAVNLWKG